MDVNDKLELMIASYAVFSRLIQEVAKESQGLHADSSIVNIREAAHRTVQRSLPNVKTSTVEEGVNVLFDDGTVARNFEFRIVESTGLPDHNMVTWDPETGTWDIA